MPPSSFLLLLISIVAAAAADDEAASTCSGSIMRRFAAGSAVPLSEVFAFFDSDNDGNWTASEFSSFKSDYVEARSLSDAFDSELAHVAANYMRNADGSVTFESFASNLQHLEKPRSALLVIDVQNDFCHSNGSLLVPGGDEIIPGINDLRKRMHFDVVAHSRDFHPAEHSSFQCNNPGSRMFETIKLGNVMQMMWPRHCVQGTWGSEFHPELLVLPSDIIVHKGTNASVDSYSAFFDNDNRTQTEMAALLKREKVSHVFVVGLATNYCCKFTAKDAKDAGFVTTLLLPLTRGVGDADSLFDPADTIIELKKHGVRVVLDLSVLLQ